MPIYDSNVSGQRLFYTGSSPVASLGIVSGMGLLGRLCLRPVDEWLGDLNSGACRQSQAGRAQVPDPDAGRTPVLLNLAREEVTCEARSSCIGFLIQTLTLLQSSYGKDADLALGRGLGTSCLGDFGSLVF